MSRMIFSTLLAFIMVSVFCQSRYGKLLAKNTIIPCISKSGYLYVGIDNPILIMVENPEPCSDHVFVKSNNGKVYVLNDTINLMPLRSGKTRLQLYAVCNGDTSNLGYTYITTKNVPDALITLNDSAITTPVRMSKIDLLNADTIGIFVSHDILHANIWFQIVSFELGYYFGGYYVSHSIRGNVFDHKSKEIIRSLAPDKILSLRVKVTSEGEVTKQLPVYRIHVY